MKYQKKIFQKELKKVELANDILKRKNYKRYINLLARNWCQVKYSDCVYAISEIKNNIVVGGTGWGVAMAINENKPVYVFCQKKDKWYFWNDGKFEFCLTPTLTKHFAGIGSRKIKENGKKYIKNSYLKTFKPQFLDI